MPDAKLLIPALFERIDTDLARARDVRVEDPGQHCACSRVSYLPSSLLFLPPLLLLPLLPPAASD